VVLPTAIASSGMVILGVFESKPRIWPSVFPELIPELIPELFGAFSGNRLSLFGESGERDVGSGTTYFLPHI
jgi:hypothetical protein